MSIGSLIIACILPNRGFIQENDPVYALNRRLTCSQTQKCGVREVGIDSLDSLVRSEDTGVCVVIRRTAGR